MCISMNNQRAARSSISAKLHVDRLMGLPGISGVKVVSGEAEQCATDARISGRHRTASKKLQCCFDIEVRS